MSTTDSDTIVGYLTTLENHTPKASYWAGRGKPLKYHTDHPILTNGGQRHPITTLIPNKYMVNMSFMVNTGDHIQHEIVPKLPLTQFQQ